MPTTPTDPSEDLLAPVEAMPGTVHLLAAPPGDGNGVRWKVTYEAGEASQVASLTFDGLRSRLSAGPTLVGLDGTEFELVKDLLMACASVEAVHTTLCRRRANHPAAFGLLPRPMIEPGGHTSLVWRVHNDSYLAQIADRIPAALWSPMIGWFTPAADPVTFGTPYLIPLGDAEDARWALMQVGVGPVENRTAAWDDAEGIRALAEACSEDPELALTVAALTDAQKVANDARTHMLRVQTLAARDFYASKNDQIRPRLVQDILHEAQRAISNAYGGGWYGRVSDHSLTPWQVFGYNYGGSRAKAVYAAASIGFDTRTSAVTAAAEADRAADILVGLLDVRGLGRVVRVSEPGLESAYVTHLPDGLSRFPAAFGISDSATMRVLPSNHVAPAPRPRRRAASS